MKKALIIVLFVSLFIGCNINPNKEERIQKLENEIELATAKVTKLENRVQTLEVNKQELEVRVLDLEKYFEISK